MQLFTEGKIDAFLGFPPEPQELRARKTGHVLVNTTVDRPWSQYFCCVLVASQTFVRANPVAAKRAVRALLKAADVCALEPERGAQVLMERGFTPRYDYALETLGSCPTTNGASTTRRIRCVSYALRLHEAGIIKASPQKIIAQGTDWRFLNALKKEMKG
jgi:NitT/TauT family transport system substrate-binding protein